MKTLDELYKEVCEGGEALHKEAEEAAANGKLAEFGAKYGVNVSEEEFKSFLEEKSSGELSDDDMEKVAGGKLYWPFW